MMGKDKERDQNGDAEFPKRSNTSRDTLKYIIKLWHSVIFFCDLSKAGNHCGHEFGDIFINSCGSL